MQASRIFMIVGCAMLIATPSLGMAESGPQNTRPVLSPGERMRMRGDLERFSEQQPHRAKIEMRRQMLRERARQRFRQADGDGNGFLNRQEFSERFPNAARHFEQIDRDRDGELSEQEMGQAIRWRMQRQGYRAGNDAGEPPPR